MARKFFYVCAGMLMLATAYQLGVTSVHGQSSATVAFAHDTGLGSYVVTPSGTVYSSLYGTVQAVGPRWSIRGTIPSSSPIVRIGDAAGFGQQVVHVCSERELLRVPR